MHILLTGGGSGGHLFPLIAVGRCLKKIGEEEDVKIHLHYMGPTGFERHLLELEGINVWNVAAAKWRRYASAQNIFDIAKLPFSVLQAFWKMFWVMPDLIFSKGGHGSLPALWVSRFYRVPVMMHESDSVPGLANRYAAKFAKKIFTSFDNTAGYFEGKETLCVGNPVRSELASCSNEKGRETLHIKFQKPVLVVLGGSQGAQRINEIVVNTLPHLLERYEIVHQCGTANIEEIRELTQKEYKPEMLQGYHPYGLLTEEEMCAAYAVADLVVSRAGASAIFEIAQAGKPSVLIPLSSAANNHQSENAHAYAKHGACMTLDEQNLTPNLFMEAIAGIMHSEERKLTMRQAARRFAKPDAASVIAREIFAFLSRR